MSSSTAILKTQIAQDLERLGAEELGEVRAHVAALATGNGQKSGGRKSLAGIWRGKGFERISDLEGEIRTAREELAEEIARRSL
ncbi:MAG: hypothetical protein GY719_27735 [bacterium]|nr:hypothetical protein [bacterium]